MRVGGGGIPLSNSTSLALVHITQAWRMEYFSFAVVQCGKWIENFLAQLGCPSSVGIQATNALLLRQNGSPKRQGLGNRLGKSRREFSVCGKRGMDGLPKKRKEELFGGVGIRRLKGRGKTVGWRSIREKNPLSSSRSST